MSNDPLLGHRMDQHQWSPNHSIALVNGDVRHDAHDDGRTAVDMSREKLSNINLMDDLSESSDEMIPMNKIKNKIKIKSKFSRKRRSMRSSDSPPSAKRSSPSLVSLCLLKVILSFSAIVTIVMLLWIITGRLYNRIDSLQNAINDLSANGETIPHQLHDIHSRLKSLESNATAMNTQVSHAFYLISNLTEEINVMKEQMTKLTDSVEAAPAIRQIPKELQSLQKIVADMGSKLSLNDNELHAVRDSQTRFESLDAVISQMKSNMTHLNDIHESYLNYLNNNTIDSINSMSVTVESLKKWYIQLLNWKVNVDERINSTMRLAQHIHDKLHNQTDHNRHMQIPVNVANAVESNGTIRSP